MYENQKYFSMQYFVRSVYIVLFSIIVDLIQEDKQVGIYYCYIYIYILDDDDIHLVLDQYA